MASFRIALNVPTPEELLERVVDLKSFLAFVRALKAEAALAESMELSNPEWFRWEGALGWENGTISRFLEAASAGLSGHSQGNPDVAPRWRLFAEFL